MCVRSSYAACPVLVLRVITWFCIQLLPMPPEAAGACAPGVPDSSELSLLDIVCIHAAACDLAIADVGFRTICTEDVSVIASLYESPREARRVAPKHPEVEGLPRPDGLPGRPPHGSRHPGAETWLKVLRDAATGLKLIVQPQSQAERPVCRHTL